MIFLISLCMKRHAFKTTNYVYNFSKPLSTISYVKKKQTMQKMKESGEICAEQLHTGSFILFSGSRPLINYESINNGTPGIKQLKFSDLEKLTNLEGKKTVLVDILENGTALFGLQLGRKEDCVAMEEKLNSKFTDLRQAFVKLKWTDGSLLSKTNALLMFHKRQAYCGACGSKTTSNVAGTSRHCDSCNETFYPTSSPVGIVLISDLKDENCLLVRPKRISKGNIYTCVAGFSDPGESLEETCKREIAEEVGLDATNITYIGSQHWPFPGSLMCGCYATVENENFQLDYTELEDGKWFSRSQITEAVDTVRTHSFSRIPEGKLIVPPPGTISHQLIRHWVLGTPRQTLPGMISFGDV